LVWLLAELVRIAGSVSILVKPADPWLSRFGVLREPPQLVKKTQSACGRIYISLFRGTRQVRRRNWLFAKLSLGHTLGL